MKKLIAVALCCMLVFAAYLSVDTVEQTVPVASAGKVYKGTVYVAGMGGHFAAASVSIDPSNTENPIQVTGLDRIVIGDKSTHPTHDPRIDSNDPTRMFWSTYKIDKAAGERAAHVGVSNLSTGDVITDNVVQLDDRATWTGALYCASGQTKTSYLPVTMTDEPYIDVFNKKSMKMAHRVFLPQYKAGETLFYHGTNDASMQTFVLAVNLKTDGKPNGQIDMHLMDLAALEGGTPKILKSNRLTGVAGKTLTFRQDFTPDGKYIMQSGADRFYLLDGKTLELVDEEMMTMGENHDAITTPDGKYAILTLRTKIQIGTSSDPAQITDGELLLYDINARKTIGKTTSVCYGCHKLADINGPATLCGADANWN